MPVGLSAGADGSVVDANGRVLMDGASFAEGALSGFKTGDPSDGSPPLGSRQLMASANGDGVGLWLGTYQGWQQVGAGALAGQPYTPITDSAVISEWTVDGVVAAQGDPVPGVCDIRSGHNMSNVDVDPAVRPTIVDGTDATACFTGPAIDHAPGQFLHTEAKVDDPEIATIFSDCDLGTVTACVLVPDVVRAAGPPTPLATVLAYGSKNSALSFFSVGLYHDAGTSIYPFVNVRNAAGTINNLVRGTTALNDTDPTWYILQWAAIFTSAGLRYQFRGKKVGTPGIITYAKTVVTGADDGKWFTYDSNNKLASIGGRYMGEALATATDLQTSWTRIQVAMPRSILADRMYRTYITSRYFGGD